MDICSLIGYQNWQKVLRKMYIWMCK